jgi:ComF family protein
LFNTIYLCLKKIIAPPFCAYCKKFLEVEAVLCQPCVEKISPVVSHEIEITKTKRMRVLAVGRYEDPLRALILAKSSSRQVASVQLGKLIWHMSNLPHISFDYVVPIPLHWTRYTWRGYNQAQEIALVIAKESSKPMLNLLQRIKRTPYLTYYAADVRQEKMKAVFVLRDKTAMQGKHLLLVDDVMTTGATLKAAARELWKSKPASITAVVVARVVR